MIRAFSIVLMTMMSVLFLTACADNQHKFLKGSNVDDYYSDYYSYGVRNFSNISENEFFEKVAYHEKDVSESFPSAKTIGNMIAAAKVIPSGNNDGNYVFEVIYDPEEIKKARKLLLWSGGASVLSPDNVSNYLKQLEENKIIDVISFDDSYVKRIAILKNDVGTLQYSGDEDSNDDPREDGLNKIEPSAEGYAAWIVPVFKYSGLVRGSVGFLSDEYLAKSTECDFIGSTVFQADIDFFDYSGVQRESVKKRGVFSAAHLNFDNLIVGLRCTRLEMLVSEIGD